ncbi:MAG: hypothetical protein JSR71_13600 [Proteobacteria bacterium]|nr:hypothetical protein [Pseudomonadota bacterium]
MTKRLRMVFPIRIVRSKAQDFGIGINWYLNRNIKFQLNYNQTHFAGGARGGANRPNEKNVVLTHANCVLSGFPMAQIGCFALSAAE